MADLKTTNIYGDAYINNKVGIATNAPATRLQIGQLSPTAATEGIQFGDDTGARLHRINTGHIRATGGFSSATFVIADNYLQTAGNLIYPASQTATQRLEVGNASGNAWVTGIAIAQGGNVTVYNNLTVNNAATVTNDLTVNGNTYLGNANNDTVYVNDTIRIGATDSGDASLFFGEGAVAGSDYGARWYWDSGYTFTWYTRNNGTDTALFDYVTNDLNYINWRRHFHMQNKEINYSSQVHFNAGTRFVGNNTSYLIFRSDSTGAGGIQVQDGGIATKGYTGYWDSAGGGILNDTGNWSLRYNFGNANSGGTLYGAWVVNGNISATNLSGTNTGDQTIGNGTITIAAGTGVGVGSSNTFTTNQSGATTVTISNNGVTSNVAGTGISVSGATGAVTITNSSPNATHTGDVTGATALTIANDAVTTVKILNANVTNAKLANSSLTIGSTAISLGATATTIAGLTSVTSTTFVGALTGNASTATNVAWSGITSKPTTLSGFGITDAASINGASNQNFSANAIYPYEWIRFMSDSGIYWQSGTYAGWHIHPQALWGMSFRSNAATDCGLQLRRSDATSLGAVYADGTSIGFLTAAFGWGASFTVAGTMNRGTVPLGRIETITAYTILGNNNASAAAVPSALTPAQVATMLSGQTMNIAGSSTSCTGNAATATSADNIDGRPFVNTNSNSATNADSINSNGISYYTGGVTNFSGNATDGGLYSQAYSNDWQHQIAGDYRSGQIALRGKNSGTWQSWRRVLDDTNSPYALNMNQYVRTTDSPTFAGLSLGTLNGSANSATLYANNASYGSWRIGGTRNGWYGIEFESGTNLMANSNEVGFHRNGHGWQFWWSAGTGYVHKGNPGGGTQATILDSVNASYAWNMNQNVRTTDSPTFNTVTANITGNAYNNLSNNYKDIYVYGDVNTYYVVLIQGESLYSFGRYSVTRGYNWTGPDTWNIASHKGGLTLDWEWSGDTAWGGNDKAIRIIEFNESYSTMVAGLGYPVNGGVIIWLRGGGVNGALYRIRTPIGSNSTVTIYDNLSIANHVASTTFTAADSTVFSTRANTNNVSAEILARYPVRATGGLFDGNNAVLHAGNYNSYSPTLTGTGASGTWGISVTGNAATATILQTARNINGTSFNGSAAITTATWGTARTLTIGSTGKSVDGSAAITWSLAEIGAAATNQTMFIGTTSVAINRASANLALTGITSIDGNAATVTNATFYRQFTVRDDRSDGGDYSLAARPTGLYAINAAGTNGPGATYLSLIHVANSNDVAFQIAGGYLSDNMYFRGTSALQNGTGYSAWRTVIHSGNIGSQTVATAGNATTAGGLAVHGGRNNEANKIVRTDSNGYIQAGWINTPSGDMADTQSINKIYCSDDDYVRYKGVADFKQQIGLTYKNATPRSSNTTDTNYWTGVMGWGTTDLNDVATWGSGFFDTWSSPGNGPGTTSHYVGLQAFHYSGGANTAYGFQMVSTTNANRFHLRSSWPTWQGWVEMLTSGNYNSFAPTLTGTGASGTWAINITGNAATATTATNVTIANGSVTLAKIENITAYTILGNSNASAAATPAALSVATVATMLSGQTMNINGSSTSCSGNAATATLATKASTLSQGGGNGTGMTFNWSGQGGQPTWLWGSNDGTNIYVWNPSNFNVNYATSAGSATSATTAGSCSGNAASATNATTAGGLAVQSGTNYDANKIVRTDGNGYILAGWINTISGDNGTTAIDRVYASSDGYIRYYTPANFRTVLDVPTRNGSGVTNFGINTAPSNRLHINGDGSNPTIRIDNTAFGSGTSSSRGFFGWLPISINGNTRYIQLYS